MIFNLFEICLWFVGITDFSVHVSGCWMFLQKKLVQATCVRCHETKCPLLTGLFSLSLSLSFHHGSQILQGVISHKTNKIGGEQKFTHFHWAKCQHFHEFQTILEISYFMVQDPKMTFSGRYLRKYIKI